jgi:aminodeoxyfutalosine synthase
MPVSDADLAGLSASHDIIAIGALADDVRRALHGARTTYLRLAAVSHEPGAPIAIPAAAGEVMVVGAPATGAAAVDRVREVAQAAKQVAVSAYSLADLEQLAASERRPLRGLLEDLRAAGLELVAEAPLDRLLNARRAIEEVNIAGLALARLTLHQLPTADIPALMKQVVALQRDVAVVRAFAPLPRRPNPAVPTTGYEDVKRVALARLFVDNVPTIQVDWALYGPKLAQVALTVGADDVDSVSAVDESAQGPRRTPREEIRRQIAAAGLEPVERTGRFEPIAG